MNDIFISYASENRDVTRQLAAALETFGWSVWWDRDIAIGKPFDHVIEEELNAARCVIVLWTAESVRSRWVKAEASAAADRERLVPVLLEEVAIPLEFRRLQTAMLLQWNGDVEHPEFIRLVEDVRLLLGQPAPPAPTPGAPPQRTTARSRPFARMPAMVAIGAVALIALVLVARAVFRSDGPPSSTASSQTSAGGEQPGDPGATSTAAAPVSPADAIAIKIGDTIGEDKPVLGAGVIERPGEQDAFTFVAGGGQRVYFRMIEHGREMSQVKWKVVDPDGASVFETCLGCGDPGVQRLRKAGTYTLTVDNAQSPATGAYRVQLVDVPAPDQFSIRIGDTIQEDAPAPGAGNIEGPGRGDIYAFDAAAGQRVYFRMVDHTPALSQIKWKLTDPGGTDVFDTCLGCGDPGVQRLRQAGKYTLTVANERHPAAGVYRLRLFDVPAANQFSIRVGDAIRENVPGPGAGHIEVPGAQDVYTFVAAAGQQVYFRMLEHGQGMSQMTWRLTDPDGMDVFGTCLGCGDPGVQSLRKQGTYTLTVGNERNPAAGVYQVQLTSGGR